MSETLWVVKISFLWAVNILCAVKTIVANLLKLEVYGCEDCGIPVPESNHIMLTISSAIYSVITYSILFKCTPLTGTLEVDRTLEVDGDGVYYRFGGTTISDTAICSISRSMA